MVVATNQADPLHPIVSLIDDSVDGPGRRVDTSARDGSAAYERHILETIRPPEGLDLRKFLTAAAA